MNRRNQMMLTGGVLLLSFCGIVWFFSSKRSSSGGAVEVSGQNGPAAKTLTDENVNSGGSTQSTRVDGVPLATKEVDQPDWSSRFASALALLRQGDRDEAVAQFREIRATCTDKFIWCNATRLLAQERMDARDNAESAALFEEVVARLQEGGIELSEAPHFATCANQLAFLYLQDGGKTQLARAAELHQEIVNLGQSVVGQSVVDAARTSLATVAQKQGNPDAFVEAMASAIADPEYGKDNGIRAVFQLEVVKAKNGLGSSALEQSARDLLREDWLSQQSRRLAVSGVLVASLNAQRRYGDAAREAILQLRDHHARVAQGDSQNQQGMAARGVEDDELALLTVVLDRSSEVAPEDEIWAIDRFVQLSKSQPEVEYAKRLRERVSASVLEAPR